MEKMKFKRFATLFLLLFTSSSLLSSCNNANDITSSESEELVELECEPISSGTCGGILIDVAVNRLLANDTQYEATFKCNSINPEMTFKSSRPQSVTIAKSTSSAESFIIETHNPGDSILQIYDYEGILVYRNVVRVRQSYTPEQITQAIYDYDIYKGTKMAGNHRMTFTSVTPFAGLFTGSDDFESGMNISFEATYNTYIDAWDMYEFTIEITNNESNSQTILSSLCVTTTADQILLYYKSSGVSEEHLLNIFFPAALEYLHEGQI
ncbi:MAG: hypothetical protein ACI31G_01005 [Bacilli bacterium]